MKTIPTPGLDWPASVQKAARKFLDFNGVTLSDEDQHELCRVIRDVYDLYVEDTEEHSVEYATNIALLSLDVALEAMTERY